MSAMTESQALCLGATSVFFTDGSGDRMAVQRNIQAKAICARCPLTGIGGECFHNWDAAGRPQVGVWFGMTDSDRRVNVRALDVPRPCAREGCSGEVSVEERRAKNKYCSDECRRLARAASVAAYYRRKRNEDPST